MYRWYVDAFGTFGEAKAALAGALVVWVIRRSS
jgi:hypothetical protein